MKNNNFLKLLFMLSLMLGVAVGCQKENQDGKNPNKPNNEQTELNKPIELEDFTVTITSLHSGDAWFNIEPKDKDMTFWFSLAIKEAMPTTDEDVYAADLDFFNYLADSYSITLGQLLGENLLKGDLDWRYNGLSAQTEYVLYMYGISTDGTPQTAVNQLTFTTTKVEPVACTFDIIEGDNTTANSFSVTIVPSDDTVAYYFDVFPASMYEEYCLSDAANIPAFIAEYIPAVASENGYDVPTTVGLISNYGSIVHDFTSEDGIQPSNTYYVFAIGIGADGTAVTEAKVISVITGRPPMNTFTLTEASVEDDRASFYVAPAHSESYVALFELQEYLYDEEGNALTDDEIIDAILAAQGEYIVNHMYTGTNSITECPLIPNKDYYLLVFGYFGGKVTTPLQKMAFKTKEADASACEFVITLGEPTTTTCAVLFDLYLTPTPHMFGCMPYNTYRAYGGNDDAVKKYNDELINSLWDPTKMSREEWLSRALETEYNSWTIDNLEPNTKYLVYIIGLVPDGTYTTAPVTREFTTKEVKEGPHIKEILFSDNKAQGWVQAWIYLDLDTEVATLKFSHIVNDDTIYKFSDEELLNYLEQEHDTTFVQEISNQTYVTINDQNLKEGDTIYYAGAAYDSDGNSRIYRETYTL